MTRKYHHFSYYIKTIKRWKYEDYRVRYSYAIIIIVMAFKVKREKNMEKTKIMKNFSIEELVNCAKSTITNFNLVHKSFDEYVAEEKPRKEEVVLISAIGTAQGNKYVWWQLTQFSLNLKIAMIYDSEEACVKDFIYRNFGRLGLQHPLYKAVCEDEFKVMTESNGAVCTFGENIYLLEKAAGGNKYLLKGPKVEEQLVSRGDFFNDMIEALLDNPRFKLYFKKYWQEKYGGKGTRVTGSEEGYEVVETSGAVEDGEKMTVGGDGSREKSTNRHAANLNDKYQNCLEIMGKLSLEKERLQAISDYFADQVGVEAIDGYPEIDLGKDEKGIFFYKLLGDAIKQKEIEVCQKLFYAYFSVGRSASSGWIPEIDQLEKLGVDGNKITVIKIVNLCKNKMENEKIIQICELIGEDFELAKQILKGFSKYDKYAKTLTNSLYLVMKYGKNPWITDEFDKALVVFNESYTEEILEQVAWMYNKKAIRKHYKRLMMQMAPYYEDFGYAKTSELKKYAVIPYLNFLFSKYMANAAEYIAMENYERFANAMERVLGTCDFRQYLYPVVRLKPQEMEELNGKVDILDLLKKASDSKDDKMYHGEICYRFIQEFEANSKTLHSKMVINPVEYNICDESYSNPFFDYKYTRLENTNTWKRFFQYEKKRILSVYKNKLDKEEYLLFVHALQKKRLEVGFHVPTRLWDYLRDMFQDCLEVLYVCDKDCKFFESVAKAIVNGCIPCGYKDGKVVVVGKLEDKYKNVIQYEENAEDIIIIDDEISEYDGFFDAFENSKGIEKFQNAGCFDMVGDTVQLTTKDYDIYTEEELEALLRDVAQETGNEKAGGAEQLQSGVKKAGNDDAVGKMTAASRENQKDVTGAKPVKFASAWFENCVRDYLGITGTITQADLDVIKYIFVQDTMGEAMVVFFKNANEITVKLACRAFEDDNWIYFYVKDTSRFASYNDFLECSDYEDKMLYLKHEVREEKRYVTPADDDDAEEYEEAHVYETRKVGAKTKIYGDDLALFRNLEVLRLNQCEEDIHSLEFLSKMDALRILEIGEVYLHDLKGVERLEKLESLHVWSID